MSEILNYIQNQIAQASHRLRSHITDPSGKSYPKRHIYTRLEKYLRDYLSGKTEQRWIVVPGLRGVGKTSVLSQLFLTLIPQCDPLRILYVSLDHVTQILNSNLTEVLKAYESLLGQSFERLKEPVFLFIDEVQYDPKWGFALKSLFDRSKKVFICCTGSSAVSLQTNPDIHRRVIMEKLYPLSFPEFQMLKYDVYPVSGLKQRIKEAIYGSKDTRNLHASLKALEVEVLQYWSRVDQHAIKQYLTLGTLPFALQMSESSQVYESISGLLDKIIQQDIESLKTFDVQTLSSIKRLLFLLADTDGVLSISKLPNIVQIDTAVTIQKVLAVLEQAELLIKVPPYGSNKSKLNKPSKYLFMSPAIRMALLGIVGKQATFDARMGRLMEDAAALHFYREFAGSGLGTISYDPEQGGADFILQIANEKELVVEIGIGEKKSTQVKQTMEKIKCTFGIVINDGDLRHHPSESIVSIPLRFFLLM